MEKGIRVSLPGGKVVTELPGEEFGYFLPHPKDTRGTLLEFIEDNPEFHDPRRRPWWSPAYWREQHPLGVQVLSHCTVAVEDLDGATSFYSEVLGCPLTHEESNAALGTQSRFFAIGDTLIELAKPVDTTSDIAQHMAAHGPIVYSFTFKVRDLSKARRHAEEQRVAVKDRGGHTFEIGPEESLGAIYGFTERDLPGQPAR